MSQKVIVIGNSLAVTIPKDSAQELGMEAGDRVEVLIDARKRTIAFAPAKKAARASSVERKIAKMTVNFMRRYDKDLRELARK